MKKKKVFLTLALLVAVIILGVGYAAAAGPWVVKGTATAKSGELDVKFDSATNGTVTSDTEATMSVELDTIGETAQATFTILNNSKAGIAATIDEGNIVVTYDGGAASSDYFTVTKQIDKTHLASGESATLTVIVELKKVGLSDVTEEFNVSIKNIAAVAE